MTLDYNAMEALNPRTLKWRKSALENLSKETGF
jgi:hypothetical protein